MTLVSNDFFQVGLFGGISDITRTVFPSKSGICVPDSCSNLEIEEMFYNDTDSLPYSKYVGDCHKAERDEFTNADIGMM